MALQNCKYVETAVDAASLFRDAIVGDCKYEDIYVLPLDEYGKCLANPIPVSSVKDEGCAGLVLGEIFAVAYKSNAKAIIVAHNHPSGDTNPSKADLEFTVVLRDMCGRLGNIELIDHLIIGTPESANGFGFVSISEISGF